MGTKGEALEVEVALARAWIREQRKLIEGLVAAIQKHCDIHDPLLREADKAEEYLRFTSGMWEKREGEE